MAITSISVVVTVVVLNFHYRGPSRKEVPSYLRELFLKRFASCSCYNSPKKGKRTTYEAGVHLPSAFKSENVANCGNMGDCLASTVGLGKPLRFLSCNMKTDAVEGSPPESLSTG
ncbi:ligand-gated ion channel subunit, putative [Caerostris darwini]|uniref:Ligand-gated ion channel subunit, putative n=1 Tax=Caerostris darwini TaxID=1538125 RepID=A0AAV4T2M3_9ARAC|nr:ligand-gated ion channel subunit, putative [Caerostris darwini]